MTTPRLRPELSATPTEEQGIKFFDVSDPRSGNKIRLYDFEWLLAEQMDGHRSADELARWAQASLHLELTGAAVSEYAERLGELGFFSAPEAPLPMIGRVEEVSVSTLTPLPPPTPGVDIPEELELSAEEEDAVTLQQEALPPRADVTQKTDSAPAIIEEVPARADTTLPSVPTLSTPPAPRPEAKPPFRESPIAVAPDEPARSSKGSMIGLVLVLLVVGAIIAYVKLFAGGVQVTLTPAKPADIVRLYEGTAKLDKAPPRTLSFGEAGKVVDVVAAGTEVKEGMPLATLDGYTKVEKDLADVKDRLGFYQKQLEAVTAKGDAAGQKAAEAKVAEKKKLFTELEAKAQKMRIVAPGVGVVEKALVAAGADVTAGAPVVELAGKHAAAVFTVGAPAASTMKEGAEVALQPAAGGATVTGHVSKVEGDKVSVELGDENATGEFRLVKTRLKGVVALPASAVTKKDGGEFVYVLSEGAVHQRPVTVAERTGGEVYVEKGLKAGDAVVVSDVSQLSDGQKAAAAQ